MSEEDQKIIEQAESIKKANEEGFNKELIELKKKWNVEQHPTIGDEIVQRVIKAFTEVPINIITKSK